MVEPALPPLSRADRIAVAGFVLIPAVVFGWGLAIIAPAFLDLLPESAARVVGIVAGIGLAAAGGLLLARVLKNGGGLKNAFSVHNVIRAGRVPDGADTQIWSAILAKQKHLTRRWGWYSAFFGLLTALYLYLAASENGPDLGFLTWVAPAGFAAIAAYAPVDARIRNRRIDALIRSLQAGDAPSD